MALPPDVIHTVVSGSNVGSDRWSFGWWQDTSSAAPAGNADLDANPDWLTFITELVTAMTTQQAVDKYDVYRYQGGALVNHWQKSVSHPGTATSGQLPLQVSLVVTLRSAIPTRRGRGRVYLPTCAFAMMGTGHLFSSTKVNTLVDKLALAFTSLGSGSNPVGVVSRVEGVIRPVVSIDADLVPDTQRRRSNELTSARHSHAV